MADIASEALRIKFKLQPFDTPGIPPPGGDLLEYVIAEVGEPTPVISPVTGKKKPKKKSKQKMLDFNTEADEIGEYKDHVLNKLQQVYCRILTSSASYSLPFTGAGGVKTVLPIVGGHIWVDEEIGPKRSDVMVIGKHLGIEERTDGQNLVGPSGILLRDTCRKLGIKCGRWYVTNLIKTEHPIGNKSQLKKCWMDAWLPVLQQEIRIVQPKYIMCMGADASKALLGKQATVSYMEGRVVDYKYSVREEDGSLTEHSALVMTCTHPAAVLAEPAQRDKLDFAVARFGQLVQGVRWDRSESDVDHRVVDDIDTLRELAEEIAVECDDNLLGVDAEWHGTHPQNKGAYLRTFQISWRHKSAACIVFRDMQGAWCFKGAEHDEVVALLMRIMKGRRICGQFLVADLEWLVPEGIDIRPNFRVADTWQETMTNAMSSCPTGGFDMGYAMHAIQETADLDLIALTLRFTTAPRYDLILDQWRRDYCRINKMKAQDLEGYGPCPGEILYPYANYDADVVRRITLKLQPLLSCDEFGNNCWEAFWMTMRAVPAIFEINTTGLLLDRDRLESLTENYLTAQEKLVKELRSLAKWPDFNLNSVFQVREFLFGEQYNGKRKSIFEPHIRLRPEGAVSLQLQPLLSTDKPPMRWEEVVRKGIADQKAPSTDKMALSLLAQEAQIVECKNPDGTTVIRDLSNPVMLLRDYRFISQVLRMMLKPPCVDEDDPSGEYLRDDYGELIYTAGLPSFICDDGRIRTHIYPTKETGRWSSARPPCQNWTKRREVDYKRILAELYRWSLRSMIMAPPGYVLVEADYVGAELFGMAVMSGDAKMIEHAKRNQLPEWHENYYDIHSNIACLAFGYTCEPTKGGLKSINMSHMRILAKAVVIHTKYSHTRTNTQRTSVCKNNALCAARYSRPIDLGRSFVALYAKVDISVQPGLYDSARLAA